MMIHLVRQNYRENTRLFNRVRRQLYGVLGGDIIIEHVGSTAISKMSGKNIIDVLVGVPSGYIIEENAQKIDKLGYFRGKNNSHGVYIFFASKESETGNGDVHIHLVPQDSEHFRDFLLLKKYLLDNPNATEKYSNFKYQTAKKANDDRKLYKLLKSKYVDMLLAEARGYYEKSTK